MALATARSHRARSLGAAFAMASLGGGLVFQAATTGASLFYAPMLAFLAMVSTATFGAAVAFTRDWLPGQVLARATALPFFVPMTLFVLADGASGHFEPKAAAMALASGAALLLARPMLSTPRARAAFAPVKFRRTFLAASSAAASFALVTGVIALQGLITGAGVGIGLVLGLYAAVVLASVFGTLRMRAWGVLLGGATSAVMLAASIFSAVAGAGFPAVAFAFGAIPGALLALPVLLARAGLGEEGRAPGASPAGLRWDAAESLPGRVRVATDAPETAPEAVPAELSAGDLDLEAPARRHQQEPEPS